MLPAQRGSFSDMLVYTMRENTIDIENTMARAAVTWLRARLPETWTAESAPARGAPHAGRQIITLRTQGGRRVSLLLEARRDVTPRAAEQLLANLSRMKALPSGEDLPVLVVASWMSEVTQQMLAAEEVNYLDLTGNARIRIDDPVLFVSAVGARKNPEPSRGVARMRGPKAGRLARTLIDVRPPYGVRELEAATGLTKSYVSRLLQMLEDEAAVERAGGRVVDVDLSRLADRWAESYDVFRSNNASYFLAPTGTDELLERLGSSRLKFAVTGSFAAVRLAPVAAPALLALYVDDSYDAMAEAQGLIPADAGANVVLLSPFDSVVWQRTSVDGGVTYAAPSQVVVDCLTGSGRMPSEGEAMLDWLVKNEAEWRLPSLAAATRAAKR